MRVLPAASVCSRRCSSSGHGDSGFTKSGVSGDTPPQSLMPACTSRASGAGDRLGGAWMLMAEPNSTRAAAMLQSSSSASAAGASAMRVPGLGTKFWTMISWMCP